MVTRDDLEKLRKKGVEDIDEILQKMWRLNMTTVIQDEKGNEYFALRSDFSIFKIFPEYMLNTIREQYRAKTKSEPVQLEFIDALKDQFYGARTQKKRKKQRDTAEIS